MPPESLYRQVIYNSPSEHAGIETSELMAEQQIGRIPVIVRE
jgi:hypothetical protein